MKYIKKHLSLFLLALLAFSTATPILSASIPRTYINRTPRSISAPTVWKNIMANKKEAAYTLLTGILIGVLFQACRIYLIARIKAHIAALPRPQDTTRRNLDFELACPICLDHENDTENTAGRIAIACSHAQHSEPICVACLEQCREYNPICPLCREPLTTPAES